MDIGLVKWQEFDIFAAGECQNYTQSEYQLRAAIEDIWIIDGPK